MICIRVGQHQIFQACDALLGKIQLNCRTLCIVAGIDEHGFSVTGKEGSISLPHIDKVYRQIGGKLCFLLRSS